MCRLAPALTAMLSPSLRPARAWASYVAARLGHVGLAGIALCAIAVVLGLGHQGLTVRRDALQASADAARTRLLRASERPTVMPSGTEARSFVTQLPGLEAVPEFIESLHREAARAGLDIERAEYRAPPLASTELVRSQVVLPLRGSYRDLTLWLARVMAEHPAAGIDELSLQRDATGSGKLRARVVLSLYSRGAP